MPSKTFRTFLIILLALIIMKFNTTVAAKRCPNFCKCDLYNDRNRADCSAKRLIHANIELPLAVEILDFSYNDIAILDDKCFENYYFLINLTITHNDIHTIYLDAFVKLNQLSNVDLSYNRLEYLDERLFEANPNLETLLLEGNKFTTLPNGPFLRSTSLKILNLRNAAINYVGAELLTALPKLTDLDLSQNIMNTLNAVAFNSLKHLKILNLDENPWTCDKVLRRALAIIQKRGVNTIISDCKAIISDFNNTAAFERIEVEEISDGEGGSNDTFDFEFADNEEEPLNWRVLSNQTANNSTQQQQGGVDLDDEDAIYFENYIKANRSSMVGFLGITVDEGVCEGTQVNLCRRYRKCLEKMSHLLIKQIQDENLVKTQGYSESDMEMAFFLGIAIGITTIMVILSCALFCKSCCRTKDQKRTVTVEDPIEEPTYMNIRRIRPRTLRESLNPPSHETNQHQPIYGEITRPLPPPQATAQPLRRSRRRQPAPSQRNCEYAVVRREPGADNFISRLFGRPARHQYYRTLNQNTATLIRRLSRSNLFNNRLSQHFVERENSRTSEPSSPHTPSSPPAEDIPIPTRQRPETPPPNYGDVVIAKQRRQSQ